jgi:D-ribose pyranose/furanose isomerase RbsD
VRGSLNDRSLSTASFARLKQHHLKAENSGVPNIHDVLQEKFDELFAEKLAMADNVRSSISFFRESCCARHRQSQHSHPTTRSTPHEKYD